MFLQKIGSLKQLKHWVVAAYVERVWLVQASGKSFMLFLIYAIEEIYLHQHLGHSCS